MDVKTREDVEKLKRDWQADPCWDLAETDGFEAYRDELKAFEAEHHARWERQRAEREAAETDRVAMRACELGCSPALVTFIESLEKRLEQRIGALEDAQPV